MFVRCVVFDDKDEATNELAANGSGRIIQMCGAKYHKQNYNYSDMRRRWCWSMTSIAPDPHTTPPFVMPSRGLCRQNGYARMFDFDPTQLWSL